MPRLFLRVLSEATILSDGEGYELGVEWLIKESDGSVRASGVTDYRGLADVADPNVEWLANPENTIVLIPSQMVLTVSCEVPGRSAGQIKRALPFAVEEFVATDIERMHIAPGPIKPGLPILCSIVERTSLASWLNCFSSLGIAPSYFVADAQLLAIESGTASVLFDGDGALVASSDQAAMVDRGTLVFALNSMAPDKIVTVNGVLTDLEVDQLDSPAELETVDLSEYGVLDYFADRFAPAACINILQGPFKPQQQTSARASKWMGVASLTAGWVAIAFLGMVVEALWSSSEADRLEQDSLALYTQFSPREAQPSGIDALRRSVASKLGKQAIPGQTNEAGGFVQLTSHFANVLDLQSQVTSLRYQARNDEITVEVMLKDYEELEVIRSKLADQGVSVEVANAEEEGGKVRSRLRVKAGE
jgi:general secretion pathway protein L